MRCVTGRDKNKIERVQSVHLGIRATRFDAMRLPKDIQAGTVHDDAREESTEVLRKFEGGRQLPPTRRIPAFVAPDGGT